MVDTAQAQLDRGEYFEAQKKFKKVYTSSRNKKNIRGKAAFGMGVCQIKLNQWQRAENSFRNSIRYDYPDSCAMLFLAQSLQSQGKYNEAKEWFQKFLLLNPQSSEAKTGLKSLENASKRYSRFQVKPVTTLNSRRSDYSPAIYPPDCDIIYFTSTAESATGTKRSEITGMKNADIWHARKDEKGNWRRPQLIEGEVNTGHDEGTVSFSADGLTMYFSRATKMPDADTRIEILTSKKVDGRWSEPSRLDFHDDSLYNYSHPALTPDGKYLYFTSDRPGGMGGYDIWRISITDGTESIINLGNNINTYADELFPFVSNDSTLYFSSTGHPGLGALDIYIAIIDEFGTWKTSNLGAPINSPADDFGITFSDDKNGYFSSNRNDIRGYDNIYSFSFSPLTLSISGYVMDFEEYSLPGATVRLIGNDGSNRHSVTPSNGFFEFSLEPGVEYVMQAAASGFLSASQEFAAPDDEQDHSLSVDFMLAPLNRPIILENILYDFDKATLRPQSKTTLDSLAMLLQKYPDMCIELRSHTDRKGAQEYNLNLSQRRAREVVNYLIREKNIHPDRLSYIGFGKSVPAKITPRLARQYPMFTEGTVLSPEFIEKMPENEREIADQINRRTEFRITNPDFYLY